MNIKIGPITATFWAWVCILSGLVVIAGCIHGGKL